jgi:PAS domain S-box-containing protein
MPRTPSPPATSGRTAEKGAKATRSTNAGKASSISAVPPLFASGEVLSAIVDISSEGIVSVGENQRILLFNQGAAALFGYAPEEVLGQPLEILIPPSVRETHHKHLQAFAGSRVGARRMGERTLIAGLRKDGTEFPAEASISKVDVNGHKVFTAVIRDITERTRALEGQRFLAEVGRVLATSLDYEETLRTVAEVAVRSLADFCAVDLVERGREVRRIEVACRDPSLREAAWALRDVELDRRRPHLVDRTLATRETVLVSSATPRDLEPLIQSPDHGRILTDLRIQSYMTVPLLAGDRMLGALLLIAAGDSRSFDEEDLRLARDLGFLAGLSLENAHLHQEAQQAIQARDDILGVVSHDLGNPLQAVFIGIEALKRSSGAEADPGMTYYLDAIHRSAEHMQRLIQELLEVRRMEAGHLTLTCTPQGLGLMVQDILEVMAPLAGMKDVRLVDRAAGLSLPRVQVDPDRIRQVLSNLVGNAVKHTPEGGTVTLEARAQDGEVLVSVIDTGPGIAEANREKVFERFWRAEAQGPKGIGLGLAIAKGIVRAHGGRIWLESEEGEGSAFHFTLPVAAGGDPSSGDP